MHNTHSFTLFAATALLGLVRAETWVESIQTKCPESINAVVGADSVVTLSNATSFRATKGKGDREKQARCDVSIRVNVPPNEQFTLVLSDFLGWAKFDSKTKASVWRSFTFKSGRYYGSGEVSSFYLDS
jgi:hypothetical protein